MKFIKLTHYYGQGEIYLNMKHVESIAVHYSDDGKVDGSSIVAAGGTDDTTAYVVKEAPAHIINALYWDDIDNAPGEEPEEPKKENEDE